MAGTFQGIRASANGLASLDNNALVPMEQLGALSQKNSCQVATTANIATLSGLLTIDGYTTLAGDRVLVKNQTTNTQNGIYVAASGAWIRSTDFSTTGDAISGTFTFVQNGTTQASTGWLCTTANTPTPVIGTNAITFAQFSGAGTYSSGTGLTLTGTTFSLNNSTTTTLGGVIVPTAGRLTVLTANTNQLTLGTTNTTTLTMAALTASRIVTLPDANSNTIQPLGSATANQWVAYIDSTGTQNLAQPAFTNISGIATIAQGGTNSATPLANNSLMYSTSGGIRELGNATNGQIAIGSTSGAPVLGTLTGTTNQVNIANGSGSITLSLPQSIATTSTPTFAQGTINNAPVSPTDIANKAYVDTTAQGLDIKNSCAVATTANIALSGLQIIDGYTTLAGDRVLVKNQTTNTQNGIYIAASGAWTRSPDFAAGSYQDGSFTFIENGTINNSAGWVCTTGSDVGTTATTFTQFSGAGTYSSGTGTNCKY
ncbi:MAG: hypothetical protein LW807_04600 [Proteobacteria bacterium]|nr:hypothetical protein [Pseudomonadota bacterium]